MTLHATCVVLAGSAVLITGPSGSGKSALALQLIAIGAQLVADDRTILHRVKEILIASSPEKIVGLIEARGVGILPTVYVAQAPVVLVVDMAIMELERLPQPNTVTLLDITLPCLHKVDAPYFPAALHAYLTGI
jgi:HPr kinase/phosphorylase